MGDLFGAKGSFRKVVRIGTIPMGGSNASVFIEIEYNDGGLLISGVIGPRRGGNARGGCGQIDMEFEHKDPKQDDSRYKDYLIKADTFSFAKGWNKEKWWVLLDIWYQYHLKSKKKIPTWVFDYLRNLPVADRRPAWI